MHQLTSDQKSGVSTVFCILQRASFALVPPKCVQRKLFDVPLDSSHFQHRSPKAGTGFFVSGRNKKRKDRCFGGPPLSKKSGAGFAFWNMSKLKCWNAATWRSFIPLWSLFLRLPLFGGFGRKPTSKPAFWGGPKSRPQKVGMR